MPGTIQIAPSILAANFGHLADEVKDAADGGADLIHVDVMDGVFVPNISLGPVVVEGIRPVTTLELDVHLMIGSPWKYLKAFAEAGADSLTVHVEACPKPAETIAEIHELGKRAGIVMSPETPVDSVEPYLAFVERVLVMSVHPGFGGQSFIADVLDKTDTLSNWRAERGLSFDIEIDGGIKSTNAARVAERGAETLVAGSAVYGGENYGQRIAEIRAEAERGLAARLKKQQAERPSDPSDPSTPPPRS